MAKLTSSPPLKTARSFFDRIRAQAGQMNGILEGAGISLGIRIAATLLTYIGLVLLARWMGPADFGIFAFALALTTLLAWPASLGLNLVILRFVAQYRETNDWGRLRGLLQSGYGIAAACAVVIAVIGIYLATFLPPRITGAYGSAVAIALVALPALSIIAISRNLALSSGWVVIAFAPDQIGYNLLLILIPGLFVLFGQPLIATTVVLIAVGIYWVTALFQLGAVTKRIWRQVTAATATFELKRWLTIAMPLFVVQGSMFFMMQTDLLVIGILMDSESVGFYHAASRTAVLVTFFIQALGGRAASEMVVLHERGDKAALQNLMTQTAMWTFFPSAIVALGLVLVGPLVLTIFGQGFETAYLALVVLVAGYLIQAILGPVGMLLNMTGQQKAAACIYFAALVINIALNFLLIPQYGMVGAAMATAGSIGLTSLCLFVVAHQYVGVNPSAFSFIFKRTDIADDSVSQHE